MTAYIVRDYGNNNKYVINTRNLKEAVKIYTELRAEGRLVDLVQKNKSGVMKNQLQAVDWDLVTKIQTELAG